jgi:hypothetical protein
MHAQAAGALNVLGRERISGQGGEAFVRSAQSIHGIASSKNGVATPGRVTTADRVKTEGYAIFRPSFAHVKGVTSDVRGVRLMGVGTEALAYPTFANRHSPSSASDRRGRYNVDKLMAEHGDAKLTDLLVTLANCEKARSFSVYDRCKAVYERL